MPEYMDKLTFAFAVAQIPLSQLLIRHTHMPNGVDVRTSCNVHYAYSPDQWGTIEGVLARFQDNTVLGVLAKGDGAECDLCESMNRVLATAHPAPWKKGIGNG